MRLPTTHELESGGAPLPHDLRSTFESRLGHDLGAIRVHHGDRAGRLAADLGAHAFTYGRHVWLGHGERVAFNSTMAHELVHAIQQEPVIRRKLYFEPETWSGSRTHREVLGVIKARNRGKGHVFVELPIPNATRGGWGDGIGPGYADLARLSSARAFGVQFDATGQPVGMPAPSARDNPGYSHARSAPKADGKGGITKIWQGVGSVTIADLKPAPAGPTGSRGRGQIQNYLEGIKHTRDRTNAFAKTRGRRPWNLPDSNLSHWTGIVVPPRPSGPKFQNQPLVIKEFTWIRSNSGRQSWAPRRAVHKPPAGQRIHGHLRLEKAAHGIVQYRWAPSYPYKPATLTGPVAGYDAKYLKPLLRDLHKIETRKVRGKWLQGHRGPTSTGAHIRSAGAVRKTIQRRRGKDTKVEDTFDTKKWIRQQRALRRDYRKVASSRPVASRRFANLAIEADRDAGGKDKLDQSAAIVRDRPNLRLVERLELWSNPKAAVLGRLRGAFGTTFAKVANVVHSARSRALGTLGSKNPRAKPNSYGGVAIRGIWRVAMALAGPAFRRAAAVLALALKTSIVGRLRKVIPLSDPKALRQAIEGEFPQLKALTKKVQALSTKVRGSLNAMSSALLKRLGPLNRLTKIARTIGTIVKIAMVAIQCVSPPLFGCLKLLASTAIARLADRILRWCYIQDHLKGLALRFDFFRDLPKTLARTFVSVLPASLQPWFDKGVLATVPPMKNERTSCSTKGGKAPTPEQRAVAKLMTDLGCEEDLKSPGCQKFRALADAMSRKVGAKTPMKAADIAKLGPLLKNPAITAKDIRDATRRMGRRGRKIPVHRFLADLPANVKKARASNRRAAAIRAVNKGTSRRQRRRLPKGQYRIAEDRFTIAAMKSKTITDVALVLGLGRGRVAAGLIDVVVIGPYQCSPSQIVAKVQLKRVRLTDGSGKTGPFGLEGALDKLYVNFKGKKLKAYKAALCP